MFSFFKRKKNNQENIITDDNVNELLVEKINKQDVEAVNNNLAISLVNLNNNTDEIKAIESLKPTLPELELYEDTSLNKNILNEDIKKSWLERLKLGLNKTRNQFNSLFGIIKIDEKWLEQLEDTLLLSDVGISATKILMDKLKIHIKKHQPKAEEIKDVLKEYIIQMLLPLEKSLKLQDATNVIMMIGVNGAGKTTSIGKLCKYFQNNNQTILLAAADTFRAAASEQLQAWGTRNNVHVIANSGDPAAVAYDAIQSGLAKKTDIILIDTAGRLPTQKHLLEELKKIKKVSEKSLKQDLHEVILVIDGNTGQNALQQVKTFNDTIKLTGLIISKLDGSAKGGILIAISQECPIPIYFIGVGENVEDLQNFNSKEFVDALFDNI